MTSINHSQRTQTTYKLLEASACHNETFGLSQSAQSLPPQAQALIKEITASFSEVRDNRVQALREQIAAGTYRVDSAELAKNLYSF